MRQDAQHCVRESMEKDGLLPSIMDIVPEDSWEFSTVGSLNP